jgi:hypothetical protein
VTVRGSGGIAGTIANQGLISADTSGQISIGANSSNSGTIEAKNGGSVTIAGPFTNSGVLKPGLNPGFLDVSSTYTQTSTGTLQIDFAGPTEGTQYSQLRVPQGGAVLAGTLSTSLVGTFSPNVGDTFIVVRYIGGNSGQFTTIAGTPGAGKAWQAEYGGVALILRVVAVP